MTDTAQHIEALRENLAAVRRRIAAAERAAGRTEGSVDLLPVTKFHPAEHVALLAELGITDVAEDVVRTRSSHVLYLRSSRRIPSSWRRP